MINTNIEITYQDSSFKLFMKANGPSAKPRIKAIANAILNNAFEYVNLNQISTAFKEQLNCLEIHFSNAQGEFKIKANGAFGVEKASKMALKIIAQMSGMADSVVTSNNPYSAGPGIFEEDSVSLEFSSLNPQEFHTAIYNSAFDSLPRTIEGKILEWLRKTSFPMRSLSSSRTDSTSTHISLAESLKADSQNDIVSSGFAYKTPPSNDAEVEVLVKSHQFLIYHSKTKSCITHFVSENQTKKTLPDGSYVYGATGRRCILVNGIERNVPSNAVVLPDLSLVTIASDSSGVFKPQQRLAWIEEAFVSIPLDAQIETNHLTSRGEEPSTPASVQSDIAQCQNPLPTYARDYLCPLSVCFPLDWQQKYCATDESTKKYALLKPGTYLMDDDSTRTFTNLVLVLPPGSYSFDGGAHYCHFETSYFYETSLQDPGIALVQYGLIAPGSYDTRTSRCYDFLTFRLFYAHPIKCGHVIEELPVQPQSVAPTRASVPTYEFYVLDVHDCIRQYHLQACQQRVTLPDGSYVDGTTGCRYILKANVAIRIPHNCIVLRDGTVITGTFVPRENSQQVNSACRSIWVNGGWIVIPLNASVFPDQTIGINNARYLFISSINKWIEIPSTTTHIFLDRKTILVGNVLHHFSGTHWIPL